jgi:adenylate cyclase
MDDESFETIGRFPFPRSTYAQALENLKEYNTAVVAFDILFLDKSTPLEDRVFIDAISKFPNVVLWSAKNNAWEIQNPFSWLKKGSYTTGYLPPVIDKSNRSVYSFSPSFTDIEWNIHEHFTLQILRGFYKYLYEDSGVSKQGQIKESEYIFSDNISYPLASKDSEEILINFIPPENFTRASLIDIYDSDRIKKLDREIGLQDKIILIGPAAEWLKDEFFTPNGLEYWVNIHANILNTLLSEQYMTYFDRHLEWIMIFFLVILSVSANLSSSNRVLLLSNIGIVGIFWFIFPLSILLWTNLILNYPSEIIFSLLLAFTSANIVKYLIEDTNKRKLNKALSEYVWVNIADEILLEQGKVNLDGQEKNLVCFFSDIEDFTSLSEKLTPGELVTFLREYLSKMTSIIMDEQWHVDKFEWDAVMALWWAFSQHSNTDYIEACNSALEQQKSLNKLNHKWNKKLWKNIRTRMGIHWGKAIIWNIGAVGRKMDFTALWDNVNLASRLEWVNKFYGTYICVSETVYIAAKDFFAFRYLDEIQVKWKNIPVKIYELLGKQEDLIEVEKQIHNAFIWAIRLYKERNFIDAYDVFSKLHDEWDRPSKTYMDRCLEYQKNPPKIPWDWVYRMTEK